MESNNRDLNVPEDPVSSSQTYSRREFLTSRQQLALVYSGLLFMLISLTCFGGLIFWLIRMGGIGVFYGERGGELWWYVGGYLPAIIMFASAFVCAVVGYIVLSAAGAAGREVIPRHDYELLSGLVSNEKEKGIDLYVRLNSLSGLTGFFTKIGITGLPLATIALSLIFTIFGLLAGGNSKLFDLANLTLGAFLGSYVQRQVSGKDKNQRSTENA